MRRRRPEPSTVRVVRLAVPLAAIFAALGLVSCSTAASAARASGKSATPSYAPHVQRFVPTRPQVVADRAAPALRHDAEFVPVSVLATRFGLRFAWTDPDHRRFVLQNRAQRLEFEVDSRECEICGLRVFLGDGVRLEGGVPGLSRTDMDLLVIPILRPGYGGPRLHSVHTIVLDAGHGGRDTGTVNTHLHLMEKTLTLDTVMRIKRLLLAAGYRVVLTRTSDRYVGLAERPEVAERSHADLFISIHFNSVVGGAGAVTGVETFTMTPQGQLSTNQAVDQYVNVFNPGNANNYWNTVLGASLHRAVLGELRTPDRGLKRGRLAVLRLAQCPAALIESGYLSNDTEARRLAQPEYRERIAHAIVAGIKAYAADIEAVRRR